MSTPADLAGVLLTEAISATIPAIRTTGRLYWILRTLEANKSSDENPISQAK